MKQIACLAPIAALAATAAFAESRELGAHQHGHGAFNIAIEGKAVAIEFTAPGADIVGFEHPAQSVEDRAAVDAAIAMLAKPLDLFSPSVAAECVVTAANVILVTEGAGDHDAHDHEAHSDHDDHSKGEAHDHDNHAHAKHDDDEHDEHAHEDEAGHTEFHADYALSCADPSAIRDITFAYFAQFPNAQELDVQLISDKGAKGFEVERDEPVLNLAGSI